MNANFGPGLPEPRTNHQDQLERFMETEEVRYARMAETLRHSPGLFGSQIKVEGDVIYRLHPEDNPGFHQDQIFGLGIMEGDCKPFADGAEVDEEEAA